MPPIKSILTACALLASFAGGYWLADNGWQKKASKEQVTLSEVIVDFLKSYIKS